MLPVLLEFFNIKIFSYPLFMGIAWGMGYHYSRFMLFKYNQVSKGFNGFFIGVFVSSWIGAKLFFLIHSSGGEFTSHVSSTYFWLGGGFVFYGGLLFGFIWFLIYAVCLKKIPPSSLAYMLPAVAYGHALGRIGCFLAGCCYGRTCELPWAIHLHGFLRHPVQLYEAFLLVLLGLSVEYLIRKSKKPISLILYYAGAYASLRFFLEYFRGDKVRGIYVGGLSTSQYVSLAIIAAVLLISINIKKFRRLR